MNMREIKGQEILKQIGEPCCVGEESFLVPSQTYDKKYRVQHLDSWVCDCPDFRYRNIEACKHIHSIQFWLKMKERLENSVDGVLKIEACPYCQSQEIVKRGVRRTKREVKQRFVCKECGKRFVMDKFKKFKGDGKTIALVIDLYFKGMSLRKIQDHLVQFYDKKVHHATIYRWISRFVNLMNEYVNSKKIDGCETWNADETSTNKYWLWNVMDKESRFLITSYLTKFRVIFDSDNAFLETKKLVKNPPKTVVTDKYAGYKKMMRDSYPESKHEAYAGVSSRVNNNKVERLNGTIKDRIRVMRGFKNLKTGTTIMNGFRLYYNYVKPHASLNGQTPAEKIGIGIQDRNKWLSLLERSIEA